MANPTKAKLKERVAITLGKTNSAVPVPKRDLAIDKALHQYVNERAWNWNWTVTSLSSGASLPAAYNSLWEPMAWYYQSTSKQDVRLVSDAELNSVSFSAFSVDGSTFRTNVTVPVSFRYQAVPPTLSSSGTDDADLLPMPDITSVERLADAFYWLDAERDEENFDRFMESQYYRRLLPRDVLRDQKATVQYKPADQRRALGWNRRKSW